MGDREAGFTHRVRLVEATDRLCEAVGPHGRTEAVAVVSADGRALAETVTARRDVPHFDRAAMDGYAVRAADTFGATDRAPARLGLSRGRVGDAEAARVQTGEALPDGADAVVMVEDTETAGDEVAVYEAVPLGENVAPVGEDVAAGDVLFEPGHQLRPSELGLIGLAGYRRIEVCERPTVGVIPTGDELVEADPRPGETVETNGATVAQYVQRWGGAPTYRDVVGDDASALRAAIQRDLTKDLVVTTGGSSVGERDLVPEVVDDLGEVLVHGVALKPGHPVGFGVVEGTPVVMLPGYPVSCIVTAVQLLRVALKRSGNLPLVAHPSTEARLAAKITSAPGVRTFCRVRLEADGDGLVARPTERSGAGVLSSVAFADGWVEVPESLEGVPAGETVVVEDWEPAT